MSGILRKNSSRRLGDSDLILKCLYREEEGYRFPALKPFKKVKQNFIEIARQTMRAAEVLEPAISSARKANAGFLTRKMPDCKYPKLAGV